MEALLGVKLQSHVSVAEWQQLSIIRSNKCTFFSKKLMADLPSSFRFGINRHCSVSWLGAFSDVVP